MLGIQLDEDQAIRAKQLVDLAFSIGFKPIPQMSTDEWADTYRILPSSTSAEHGKWRTSRVPYAREPMRLMSPNDPTPIVVLKWGSQTAKSESMLNAIGQRLHLAPGPMMLILPTVDVGRNFSKERIDPLIALSPVLVERVLENRSRDGENTIFVKRVLGGFLKVTGANSAASLRSTPIRDLFGDEIDSFTLDVDGEGDPIMLAEARTTNFRRGKKVYSSTPGLEDESRIEKLFKQSDQRRYYVPCPHCGEFDYWRWKDLRYNEGEPESALMSCGHCGVLYEEHYKTWCLEHGEWRATVGPDGKVVGDGRTAGFHLNTLYSPMGWFSWAAMVREWEAARGDVLKRKAFINTRLAETWKEYPDSVDPASLLSRREAYEHEVPDGVGALVASVDVQKDRLEWKIVGYGANEESWLIAAAAEMGDTTMDDVWLRLDEILRRRWTHASGDELPIECVAVDAQYRSDQVYKFCKARTERRFFAVRGGTERGKPIVGKPTTNNSYRARLYTLCTDSAKELIYARLRIPSPGPGYVHLPEWVDKEYVDQLMSEKPTPRQPKNRPRYIEWVPTRDRNEALDLEVYCLAAVRIRYGPQTHKALASAAAKLSARAAARASGAAAAPPPPAPKPASSAPLRPRTNWVTGGKEWKV